MADNQVVIEPGQTRPDDSLNTRIFKRMLPIESRAVLGIVFFFVTLGIIGWIGINEQTRMQTFTAQFAGRSIQRGASIFNDYCSPCHGRRGEGLPGIAPTLNRPEEFDGTRLREIGWTGSLENYLLLTVSGGRPARTSPDWPNPMPTWSQDFGGPLRPDQIQDVVNFVMNWGCAYDPECAGPNYTPAAPPTGAEPTPTPAPVDCAEVADRVLALEGDPDHGQQLFSGSVQTETGSSLVCYACHSVDGSALVGPSQLGVSERPVRCG